MFSWIPLHKEAVARVLQFEDQQSELLKILDDMNRAGLNVIPLIDQPSEGVSGPLTVIDPFSFFAVFNRSLTYQNRLKNWAYLKQRWQLRSELPRDFDGIPILHPQNAWFFPYAYRRPADDVASLWKLARAIIERGWAGVTAELCDRCLAIHTVGLAKLTTGLFWIAPTECLPLAATTVEYLKAKGVWREVTDKASLDTLLREVQTRLSKDFVQESHKAWQFCATAADVPFDITPATRERLWAAFLGKYPGFVDFAHPGEAFSSQETDYKRRGLKKLQDSGGRDEVRRLLAAGDPAGALQLIVKSVSLNIASYQSWRPSVGADQPAGLADVLRAVLDATEKPYEGLDTLLPVFNTINLHGLNAAWDTLSVLLWGLRPTDYFPIKISYYRELAARLGFELEPGKPTPEAFHRLMAFGRAMWDVAAPKGPRDWVDVQSFTWGLCQSYGVDPQGNTKQPAKSIWLIAPGEQARLWEDFRKHGIVAIGWDYLDDLTKYGSKKEIAELLRTHDQSPGRRSNDAHCCWEFAHEISPGDLVVVKEGRYKLIGLGRVTSAYLHQPEREEYQHVRQVEWLRHGEWEIDEALSMKTLTNVTPYPDFVKRVLATIGEPALFDELYGTQLDADEVKPPLVAEDRETPTVAKFDRAAALNRLFMADDTFDQIIGQLRRKKNVILQGPPGVGKTYVAQTIAYALMGEADADRVQMVQFHQSYGYEEFVQGLRPTANGSYVLRPGLFLSFCQKAAADTRPWVFIIDEINRGSISKILGELMMLLEPDKRDERYALPLAYADPGDPEFFVPPNVYIIGLMNTADRSLAMIDYALRRRFAFVSLRPEIGSPKFKTSMLQRGLDGSVIDALVATITRLNDQIRADEADLGEGFCIGHSYFCPPETCEDLQTWLRDVLEFDIAPLLREYWVEQADKAEDAIKALKDLHR